jgi:hypothetical protein
MTDTVTSLNIDLSSWDSMYNLATEVSSNNPHKNSLML